MDLSKSPMLTGEDPQGAAGLQALLTLRTSLSPPMAASDLWRNAVGSDV